MSKELIQKAAEEMIVQTGLINLSRQAVCDRAGVSEGSFTYIMGCTFTAFLGTLSDSKSHKAHKGRSAPAVRKESLLSAAVAVAKEVGYNRVTREAVADYAGVSISLTSHYFSNMNQFKRAIMRHAVTHEELEVIAQGITLSDPLALKAPEDVKAKVLKLLGAC